MIYPEDREEAEKVAETALGEMKNVEVPPNPLNYSVWFEHLAGRNPALSRLIETMMERNMRFTPDRNRDIYSRFVSFGDDEEARAEWTSRMEANARRMATALREAGAGTEEYGKALAHFSGGLSDAESKTEIDGLISTITAETSTMEGQIQSLQKEVAETRAEMDAIRGELDRSRQEAMTDRLTGIANRRHFDVMLETLMAEAEAERTPLSLTITDIDHFKKFNDTFGHQVGDQVLKVVARALVDGVKGRDVAARYGGEEFVVILPDTAMAGASTVAEKLRSTVASRKLSRKGSQQDFGSITMSFGVTEYVFGESAEEFIARADALLYKAKEEGRNRVAVGRSMPHQKKIA